VIDETTLVIYFFSNNKYSIQYEKDLVESMKKGRRPLAEIGISESTVDGVSLDHSFVFSENGFTSMRNSWQSAVLCPPSCLDFYFASARPEARRTIGYRRHHTRRRRCSDLFESNR